LRSVSLVLALAAAALVPGAASGDGSAPDPSYLPELVAAARVRGLAREKAWLRLGHWRPLLLRGFESEVDGPDFFLAPGGKRDPEAELEATLRAFFAPARAAPAAAPGAKRDVKADHAQCRFPARFVYLARALRLDPARLPPRSCPLFEEFHERVGGRSVTLVFSSYYLNNPSSAFGHTFLRLGKTERGAPGDRLDLIDQGVDYAATVTTSNALLYIVKGLTGLFRGEFTARPYFYKVREYADYESRNLWEYELALGPLERAMLVAHLWELGQTWFDYFYLTENCSYHVLGALEAADPDIELLAHVGPVVLPADAVKSLFANRGLVRDVRFRPSARTQLAARAALLSGPEVEEVAVLADGGEPAGFAAAAEPVRVRVLDTALDLVDVRHGRAIVEGTDPAADALRQRLLERRSAIAVASDALEIQPPSAGGPERGHGALRVGAGGGASTADGPLIVLDGRLALHDLADPPAGFSPRTQLEFLKVRVAILPRAPSLRLDEASLVEATSLNAFDRFERRVSWKLRAGASRVVDAGCRGCVAGQLEAGGGPALVAGGGALAAAVTGDAELLGAPDLRGLAGWPVRPGLGPGAMLRLLGGERVALLGTATWRWLPLAAPRTTFRLGATARLHLGAVSVAAEWCRTPIANEVALSLLVYGR
jgi:Domain of unknown function (DUF4105)